MEQQIAPSASAQASSGAIKAATGQGKSAAKGMFAALLSIIEGKGKPANGKGSEKLFEQVSAQGDAKLPANPKAKTTKEATTEMVAAAAEPAIQMESPRKPGLKMKGSDLKLHAAAEEAHRNTETRTAVPAADNLDLKHGKPAAATPLTGAPFNEDPSGPANDAAKAKSGSQPSNTSRPTIEAALASATNRPAKIAAMDESKPTVASGENKSRSTEANVGAQSRQPAAAPGEQIDVVIERHMKQTKMVTTQPVRHMATKADETATMARSAHGLAAHEIGQASARDGAVPIPQIDNASDLPAKAASNRTGATKEAAVVSSKPMPEVTPATTTVSARPEEAVSAANTREHRQAAAKQSAHPTAELRPEVRQAASLAMQADKGSIAHHEASLASNLPELQRFSTNHFVKNRKINLESLSRSKNSSAMAGSEKRPEAIANNPKHIFMPQGEASMPVNRDVAIATEAFPRTGQPVADNPGSAQTFQIAGAEATATRAASNPIQATPHISGPWSVAAAMQQIGHAAAQGKFQLELTLNPEHLGKIQVFLESDASKQIQVHLIVDQPASRQPIEQHLPMLRQALAEQGLSMENFSMASSGEGDKNPQQQEQQHLPGGTAMAENTPHISERPAPAPADSRLSIRV